MTQKRVIEDYRAEVRRLETELIAEVGRLETELMKIWEDATYARWGDRKFILERIAKTAANAIGLKRPVLK